VRETKRYYVYILTNPSRHPFYTGMTNSIDRRMTEHRDGLNEGYTGRYNLHWLVYYESFVDVRNAIDREKEIKSWSRARRRSRWWNRAIRSGMTWRGTGESRYHC
jgi:putative endonuclease